MLVKLVDKVRYDYVNEVLIVVSEDIYEIEGLKKSVLGFLDTLKTEGLENNTIIGEYSDLNRQYIYTKNSLNNFKIDEAKRYGLNFK